MKKYKEIFFSVLNFAVIAALIAGIMLGLNRIGILSFPRLSELFGSEGVNVLPYDEGKIYESLEKGVGDETVTVVSSVTPENVRVMLESVAGEENYYQEADVTVFGSDGKSVTEKATVQRVAGHYGVSLYTQSGELKKRIEQTGDSVKITAEASGGKRKSVVLEAGDFDIEDESGVVMTHKRFLEATDGDGADYSVAYSEYGTVMLITFVTDGGKYLQTQKYWLSLDYGVVVRAECYENDSLVYLLETTQLSGV